MAAALTLRNLGDSEYPNNELKTCINTIATPQQQHHNTMAAAPIATCNNGGINYNEIRQHKVGGCVLIEISSPKLNGPTSENRKNETTNGKALPAEGSDDEGKSEDNGDDCSEDGGGARRRRGQIHGREMVALKTAVVVEASSS
ncbi:hypothetical protein PIB30_098456, partial [Stylosanthes scabra]|nr:hypothetical protein [Stylosanthes scabra]